MPAPHYNPLRVPLCLRLALGTGATDTVVHCPHCGGLHAVELAAGEDVSWPITCPEYPSDMPLVAVRNRYPEP
jgi:hypothetical protein